MFFKGPQKSTGQPCGIFGEVNTLDKPLDVLGFSSLLGKLSKLVQITSIVLSHFKMQKVPLNQCSPNSFKNILGLSGFVVSSRKTMKYIKLNKWLPCRTFQNLECDRLFCYRPRQQYVECNIYQVFLSTEYSNFCDTCNI